MNVEEFRNFGKFAVDYLATYLDTIRQKQVLPEVEPGYLQKCLPKETPENGEQWKDIFSDIDKLIIPGLTNWHSPAFSAYLPTGNSYEGIIGELILSGIGGIATTWDSNPASIELELKMMDWLAKMMELPEYFLNSSGNRGGGCIQNSASDSTLLALLVSKQRLREKGEHTEMDVKFVAYTSDESNSSVEKAGLLASIPVRLLPTDYKGRLDVKFLEKAISKDRAKGLVPCCVIATFGTTGICSFDNVEEIGDICEKESLWLHVDAAYAGTALICPEFRHLMRGIEKLDSFCFNPHKWMKVNSDCSALWFRDASHVQKLTKCKDDLSSEIRNMPKLHLWQIPNCRRFRALKLWFVLRIHGVKGLQKHVRNQVALATYFATLIRSDERFEICTSNLGVVTFRLKGNDEMNKILLTLIQKEKKLFLMPYYFQGKLVVRFVVCSSFTEEHDIDNSWKIIQKHADHIMLTKETSKRKIFDAAAILGESTNLIEKIPTLD